MVCKHSFIGTSKSVVAIRSLELMFIADYGYAFGFQFSPLSVNSSYCLGATSYSLKKDLLKYLYWVLGF